MTVKSAERRDTRAPRVIRQNKKSVRKAQLRAQHAARRRRLAVLIFVPVVAVGTAVGVILSRGGTSSHPTASPASPSATAQPQTPGQVWMNAVVSDDFKSITGVILGFDQTLNNWQTGKATAAEAGAAIDHALPDIIATRERLAERAPLPAAPQALTYYRESVNLYIEGARVAKLATQLPSGALQTQEENASLRMRDLGDRLVDQAGTILKPFLPSDNGSGVTFVPTPEVPDWASLDLAPGPPLDVTPPVDPPQKYQTTRPQQPAAGWQAAVRTLNLPTATTEASTIATGTTAADKALSEKLAASVSTLNTTADPSGDRADSVRLRLDLLIYAEAARTAQAATLAPAALQAPLRTEAQSLTVIGDQFWPALLGTRSSGLPQSLLTRGTSQQTGS